MATANTLIDRALRLTGVIASGETPEPSIIADTLSVLNAMLAEWYEAEIGVPEYSIAGYTSAITTDAADNDAIAYQLAIRIAPEYGMALPPELLAIAEQSWSRLALKYFQAGQVDSALPSQRAGYNIDNG